MAVDSVLGGYRQPGAIVVARRSIRRALNRQIRGLVSNPATHIERFFLDAHRGTRNRHRRSGLAAKDPNPALAARAFNNHIAAVTCSGPMS